jgi:hypothetical protein
MAVRIRFISLLLLLYFSFLIIMWYLCILFAGRKLNQTAAANKQGMAFGSHAPKLLGLKYYRQSTSGFYPAQLVSLCTVAC